MVDEGQIILEMHDLEFSGSSMIQDPRSNLKERVEFTAPIGTCQIVLSLGEEYSSWGSLYPRVNID